LIAVSGAASLDLNGFNQCLVGISGSATNATITNSAASPSVLTLTGTSSYAGAIKDNGGAGNINVTVTGPGLTLSGTNTYSDGTVVASGSTLITSLTTNLNSLGTGPVVINSGATNQVNNVNAVNIPPVLGNAFTGSGRLIVNFATNTTGRNTTSSGVAGFNGTLELANAGATGDKWNTGSSGVNAPGLTFQVDSGSTIILANSGTNTFAGITLSGAGNTENRGALRCRRVSTVPGTRHRS
jgi:hypothetical protein